MTEGTFGENLTLAGLDVTGALIGERWEIGSTVLEVSQPRTPCWKLGARMGDPEFPVFFAAAGRPGAYLRIVEEGELGAGDPVRVVGRPSHRLTVGDVAQIYHGDRDRRRGAPRRPRAGRGVAGLGARAPRRRAHHPSRLDRRRYFEPRTRR